MKLIKTLLSIIGAFAILWVMVALFSPKYISVQESIVIENSASTIFNQVNNFTNWKNWSEWNRKDSLMELSYSSPSKGMGASLSWKSKTEGNGSQSIIESIPFEKIRIQLKMNDWGENYSNWEFEELKEFQTKVTWTFEDSEISFLLRPMGFSFTNAIREDYINSLVNLQYFCEHENQQNKKIKPGLIECDSIIYIGKHIVCTYDEMGPEMGKAYSELMRICTDQDLTILDMPFSIIYDAEPGFYEFDAAFKIDQLIKAPRGFVSGVIPGGETVSLSHYGLSENLPASYKIIENWIQENGYLPDGNPYEVYVTEPSAEPDSSKWETQIFYPVKKLSHEAILN